MDGSKNPGGSPGTERPGHPNPSLIRPGFYEEYHPELEPDIDFLARFIAAQNWIFAKTMPQWPHWYVVRGKGPVEEEFVRFVHHIRSFGYDEPWFHQRNRYLDCEGYKYWTMGFVMSVTIVINRCKIEERPPHPFSEQPQMFFAKPASPGTKLYQPA